VLLGVPIAFFVAIQIMFSKLQSSFQFIGKHPIIYEMVFRALMIFICFTIAETVPRLSLLLSLVGSVGCVVLAFVFPVLSELIVKNSEDGGIKWYIWIKNILILFIALAGFLFGGGIATKQIVTDLLMLEEDSVKVLE
jgi:solute carrier family 36 (proton-coupled amino acid transporter)